MKKIVFLMLLVVFVIGCQSNPENKIVLQRDNAENRIYESNDNPSGSLPYEAPKKIKEEIVLSESLELKINAKVVVNERNDFPVVKLKAVKFSKETADTILNYLFSDAELFSPKVLTKEDYDSLIISAKKNLQEADNEFNRESYQEMLNNLIEKRDEAPDDYSSTPIKSWSIDTGGIEAALVKDGKEYGTWAASENKIYFRRNCDFVYEDELSNNFENKVSNNFTEDMAINSATDTLYKLDIEGFGVEGTQKVFFIDTTGNKATDIGYRLIFMRELGKAVPVVITSTRMNENDDFSYTRSENMEVIEIILDSNSEIQLFSWAYPKAVTDIITDAAPLMPFEEMMDTFYAYVNYKFVDYLGHLDRSPQLPNETVKITKISLKPYYLSLRNNMDEFMYAPCWFFEYKVLIDGLISEREAPVEYLIFNAIDGGSVSTYTLEEFEAANVK